MIKKLFAAILALCFVLSASLCVTASAEDVKLRFDENGEFKILHICDCQDGYPASEKMLAYIDTMLKKYEPDLVVLGGDNTVGEEATKELAVEELVSVFVENKTYFTFVFGNHDHQQGYTEDELLPMYQRYGGEYCLAYDEVPALHGTATHNLPIYASASDELKFSLWMFDSGSYVYDENGNDIGYDSVTEDQINWYKEKSKTLVDSKGNMVKSLSFQHIIVGDVYDALFVESAVSLGEISREFNGKVYSFLPKTNNFSGFLAEFPCPGVYNHGQFKAMVETGNVLATFSGHDHTNSFETELDGVKIINTPGATYHFYGNDLVRGSRLITINEDDTSKFESKVISAVDLALEDADFAELAGISKAKALFTNFGRDLLLFFGRISGLFAEILY